MNENDPKERTILDLIKDLLKLVIPFIIIYIVYILFLK